ncbi:MAG: hypothetical protein ABEK59_01005 [Halobacteria archaeon]
MKRDILDDEAVSVVTGYVVNVAVAVAVITLFIVQSQTIVQNVRESTDDTELTVVGNKVAIKLYKADEIATESPGSAGNLSMDLPAGLSENSYKVYIQEDPGSNGNGTIYVSTRGSDTNVSTIYNTSTNVKSATFTKFSDVDIEYTSSKIEVVE